MSSTSKNHLRGSSLLLGGRFLALGINFVVQVIIVRALSKSDYGAFAYALSMVLLGTHVASVGLDKAISRFVPIHHEHRDYRKMAGAILFTLATILVLGVAVAVAVIGLRGVIAQKMVSDPLCASLLAMLVLLVPITAVDKILEKLFAIFARPKAVFFRRHVLGPGLKLLAAAPLIFLHDNVYILAVCYLAAGVLGAVFSAVLIAIILKEQKLLLYFRPRMWRAPWRTLLQFSLPLMATDLVFVVRTSLVTVLVEFFHGAAALAGLRAVLPVARLNLMVMESFKLLFTPLASRLFAREDGEGIERLYWRNAAWIAILTFPLFVLSFSFAQPLTVFMFGERYHDSGLILAVLSLGCYLNASFGFNAVTLRVYGNVRTIVINDLGTAAAVVALNFALVPPFGALGGAIAATSALALQNVLHQIALVRCGAVRRLDAEFVRVYLSIILVAGAALLVQWTLDLMFYAAFLLATCCSLLVLRINLAVLDIGEVFPELLRIGILRKILSPRQTP